MWNSLGMYVCLWSLFLSKTTVISFCASLSSNRPISGCSSILILMPRCKLWGTEVGERGDREGAYRKGSTIPWKVVSARRPKPSYSILLALGWAGPSASKYPESIHSRMASILPWKSLKPHMALTLSWKIIMLRIG